MLPRVVASAITGFVRLLTGAQALWVGCAPEPRQRIYFANHQSHGDFVLLWATLPRALRRRTRPVAGADYWLNSSVRRFLIHRVFHGVLVDRTREQRSADPLEVMLAALGDGDSLIIFPEGTRNTGPARRRSGSAARPSRASASTSRTTRATATSCCCGRRCRARSGAARARSPARTTG